MKVIVDTCNICGEEQGALIHTDKKLHPDDAVDGLFLHQYEPPYIPCTCQQVSRDVKDCPLHGTQFKEET